MYMKSADLSAIDFYMDLFDIDFHIFTVIKILFNLGVRIK